MEESQFSALAPHYDELMRIVPYKQWVEYVELLCSVVGHTPRRILDCACGTGNVSFELARLGYDVTGVDLSEEMIQVAQHKARRNGSGAKFYQADLANFKLGATFDTATCLYDSLNYILEPAKLQAAFGRIAKYLEKGGIFVFDMNSVFALSSDLFTQRQYDPRKQLHYDWKASYDKATKICTVQMEFKRKAKDGKLPELFHETHRERAYELEEVEAMLEATGWLLLQKYDAYTLNPPHKRSERWYFVAMRV